MQFITERDNVTDWQNGILAEPTINTKADQN